MKHRTGHLRKRGSSFYLRWVLNGRVFERALRDENGHAITDRRKAEQERVRVMAPFKAADETAALESIAGKIEGRKAELARLDEQQNPALPLHRAWSEFVKAPNRPDSGETTMRQYGFQFARFADWAKEIHPELSTLREVTKEIAEEYATQLNLDGLSPGTFNKHLNLLTLVFRVLRDKARIINNPWTDIQRKRNAVCSRRELSIDELKCVCQSATGELRTLLGMGVYSGLRLGDCATLRWGEVDLTRGIIRRIPNKTARRNPTPVIVPIHSVLKDMLVETPTAERREYVLPETAKLYARRIDLVTDLIQQHFTKCGITLHRPGTGTEGKRAVLEVGFHSLRHSFVSLCRDSNAPLAVVESIVGHSNPAMTRHYTHVGEVAAGRAVAALPSVIGAAEPQSTKQDAEALLLRARAIVRSLTAENWQETKSSLIHLLTPLDSNQSTLEAV